MPTTSTLNKDHHRGHLFSLHLDGSTPQDAHALLLEFTEIEIFTLEEVTGLFYNIDHGLYQMNFHKDLLLAENGVFNEGAVLEFLTHRYCHVFFADLYNDLLKITGRELFSKEYITELSGTIFKKDHERMEMYRDFNKDSLKGFLIGRRLKKESARQAHSKLLEITKILSLEDVEKLYEQIDRGEYLVQKHEDRLWKAFPQYNFVKSLIEHADLESRKSLHQTCGWIRDLVTITDCQVESVNINFVGDTIKIVSKPKMCEETFESFYLQGCVTHRNGKVWYRKQTQPEPHRMLAIKKMDIFAAIPNLKIKNFNLKLDLSMIDQQQFPSKYEIMRKRIRVENFYANIDNFRGVLWYLNCFYPENLKKLVIFSGNHRYSLQVLGGNDRWEAAEVLITNQRFEEIDNGRHLAHFKFAVFELHYVVTIDQVLAIKDTLLLHPDLREFKITCQMLPDHYDDINIRIGTYNPRGARSGRWAQFQYAAPNADKILQLCVLEGLVWFRGPGFVEGEMELAVSELRSVETLNDGVFEEIEYRR